MKKNIAVVMCGAGHLDGSEITETVSTLIALDLANCQYKAFSPDLKVQRINHLTQSPESELNTLVESARIMRGQVTTLAELNPDDFDAVIFPGGFGVAKHLCSWATDQSKCSVDPMISEIVKQFHANSKPIGAICISPALVAKILCDHDIYITIGNDLNDISEVEKTGASAVPCPIDDFITDRANKIVSTPAFMLEEASPGKVFLGISALIKELVEMA